LKKKEIQIEEEEKAVCYTGISIVERSNNARIVEAIKYLKPICGKALVANSAGCECLFSQMGVIHTKQQSRLKLQWVQDMVTWDFNLEGEEGMSIQAEEMEMEGVDAECSSTDHDQAYIMTEVATSAIGSSKNVFSLLVNHLLEEVEVEDAAAAELEAKQQAATDANLGGWTGIPTAHHMSFVSAQTSLETIFNFSPSTSHTEQMSDQQQKPIGMYWRSAIKNMKQQLKELELYKNDFCSGVLGGGGCVVLWRLQEYGESHNVLPSTPEQKSFL
ncbi:hypothetical protein FRC11_000325, partial [Ceratobasidium sp. 423]